MANAPTRPPTYRAGQRPSKGPRRVPGPMRDRLLIAAQHLEDAGHPESAADVRAVAAPGGWTLLRATGAESTTSRTTLTLTLDKPLKEQLVAKAADFDVTLSSVAEDGLRKVLAGEWMPPKLVRKKSVVRSVLNLRIDDSLRQQIEARQKELSEQAGYRVTQSSIAVAWMAEELGVELATQTPSENDDYV